MKLSFGLFPEAFAPTRDQIELRRYNVVSAEASAEARTLPGLGIAPES